MKDRFTPSHSLADYLVVIVLALVPFQAFLTVWTASIFGHYTLLRLWDDILLVLALSIAGMWLIKDLKLRQWFFGSTLVRLIVAYGGLTVLLGLVSLSKGEVAAKALAYGLLINLRFLAWFLAVLLAAQQSPFLKSVSFDALLAPAAVVVLFASLQYTVLPHNFLAHFGYKAATTIAPIETIDHNSQFIRVQSTLRGANPLGAYLVIILSMVGALLLKRRYRLFCSLLAMVALFALYASGSRSAWIGALLSLSIVGWLQLKTRQLRLYFGIAGLALAVLVLGAYLLLRGNVGVQNELLHTQSHSASKVSSNAAHASALKNGISDVLRQPLGDGPGTAGPASEYNTGHPVRIAENYYVQVAQETGWLGLMILVSILVLVGQELYERARGSELALALFAALIGLSFVNMLSHAWADPTLAYIWWGFTGIMLGSAMPKQEKM